MTAIQDGRLVEPVTRLDPEVIAAIRWGHESAAFAALSHRFRIRTTNQALGRFLSLAFEGCLSDLGESETEYTLIDTLVGPARYALYLGADLEVVSTEPAIVLAHMLWQINHDVIHCSAGDFTILHAAAAILDDRAVVLPAAMESGKSTLVAALLGRGFGYLSDEAVGIDTDTLHAHPFAKPISLDPGSWRVLPELEPDVDEQTAQYLVRQWQVPASVTGSQAGRPAPIATIIFPRYAPDATLSLTPIEKPAALLMLLSQTFGLDDARRRSFDVLSRLVERTECYEVTYSNVTHAAAATEDLVRTLSEGGCHDRSQAD